MWFGDSLHADPLSKGGKDQSHESLPIILDFWNLLYALSHKITMQWQVTDKAVNNGKIKLPHKGNPGKEDESLQINSKGPGGSITC